MLASNMSRRVLEAWNKIGTAIGLGIPAPTGKFEVGSVDLMHKLDGESYGLLVRLFYPVDNDTRLDEYQYSKTLTHPQYLKGSLDFIRALRGQAPSDLKPEVDIRGPSWHGAPLATTRKAFPVIVFSHGFGGMRTSYTGLSCDLASHGFILASVEHQDHSACATIRRIPKQGKANEFVDEWLPMIPPRTGKRGRQEDIPIRKTQVRQRANEISKALDIMHLLHNGEQMHNMMQEKFNWQQFKGRLQMNNIAVMGHSFGGATTVQTLYTDKRFRCGIAMDCYMTPLEEDLLSRPLDQPLLFINSDHDFQGPTSIKKMMKMVQPKDQNGISRCQILTLKGSCHFHQCDFYFTSPTANLPKVYSKPELDPIEGHQLNSDICQAFFHRFLLKDPNYQTVVDNLDGGKDASKHILFGTNIRDGDKERGEFAGLVRSSRL